MKRSFEARPTEYKGVVYKSKCEAMFARFLELEAEAYNIKRITAYEPEFSRMPDGWVADFHVGDVFVGHDGHVEVHQKLIEYKPSRPTDTYIAEFFERSDWLSECGSLRIYWGSVFIDESGVYTSPDNCTSYDWARVFKKEIEATRFDLRSDGNGW
jgi:hypothetical protein